MTVTIPANTTAEIWVPTSGQPVSASEGAKFLRFDTFDGIQYAVDNAGPGAYEFNGQH